MRFINGGSDNVRDVEGSPWRRPRPAREREQKGSEPVPAEPKQQRKGRSIAMSPEELDDFLGEERMCRVASVGADGRPHNSPLWFVWDGSALWLNSIVKSQRWV